MFLNISGRAALAANFFTFASSFEMPSEGFLLMGFNRSLYYLGSFLGF